MKFTYLAVLLLTLAVPLALSGHPTLKLYEHKKSLVLAVMIPSVLFWTWDIAASYRGHWGFHPAYVLDFRFLNLPAEEYLFFVVVGFVSIFTYEVVKSKMKRAEK